MQEKKQIKLPRGLRWHSESRFIWFTWRDAQGKQHQKSTETTDPMKAMLFKMVFLEKHKEAQSENEKEVADLSSLPLGEAAKLYFEWKSANGADATIVREKRIFKSIEKFFGIKVLVKSIKLRHFRNYQKARRKVISPTMKQTVTARTVNYELYLLRSVMVYADCWSADLSSRYQPLRHIKRRSGKAASKEQLMTIIAKASTNEYWQLAMFCAAVAAGTGCRGCEIKNLQLKDIDLGEGTIRIIREIAKNRKEREPRLMSLAEWGLRNLLLRARLLGATEPDHYLLPFKISQSSKLRSPKPEKAPKWDVNRPMVTWVKSWRKLMVDCGTPDFRFHDLRHTFRTQGAEAGVPLEVMMAQLGHMDRETSLEYVHIQQRALDRAKQLIEVEQAEILTKAHEAVPLANAAPPDAKLLAAESVQE